MATGNQKGTGIGHLLSRILITLVLIGVLCGCFCGIAFAMYVHIYINPSAQETAVEISKGLGLNLNSFIYAKESDSDEYTLYETIKGKETVNGWTVTRFRIPSRTQSLQSRTSAFTSTTV